MFFLFFSLQAGRTCLKCGRWWEYHKTIPHINQEIMDRTSPPAKARLAWYPASVLSIFSILKGLKMGVSQAKNIFCSFKQRYPGALLFFQMGDFYETFYDDARICSRVCGSTLAFRNKGGNIIPVASIPHNFVDNYLKKLTQAGHKVAVLEQVECTGRTGKSIKREVVRVIMPKPDSRQANRRKR